MSEQFILFKHSQKEIASVNDAKQETNIKLKKDVEAALLKFRYKPSVTDDLQPYEFIQDSNYTNMYGVKKISAFLEGGFAI